MELTISAGGGGINRRSGAIFFKPLGKNFHARHGRNVWIAQVRLHGAAGLQAHEAVHGAVASRGNRGVYGGFFGGTWRCGRRLGYRLFIEEVGYNNDPAHN